MREPAVSIITPTRNRAALLVETLDSVATQALDDWEHLVVDDGSDDGTAELMARRTATDRRVRYLVREHDPSGANACRNIGLRAARAALVLMLDSDDLLSADCLARRVRIMQRNPDFDFATFQSAVFTDQIGDYPREVLNEIAGDDLCRFLTLREAPWIITAPIWRREALLGIGGFDERLPSLQDIELHVRAICAGLRYVRFAQVDHHIRWRFDPSKVSHAALRSPKHLEAAPRLLQLA